MKGIGFAVFAGLLLAHASAFSLDHGRIGHAPHAGLRSGTTCAWRRKPAISRLQSSAIPAKSDPWGGRIGSMGALKAKDGFEVLEQVLANLPRSSGYETWKSVFTKFDQDSSGMLDGAEMAKALRLLTGSVTDEQVVMVMKTLDQDNDGGVSYGEFAHALEIVELRMEQNLLGNDVMNDPDF